MAEYTLKEMEKVKEIKTKSGEMGTVLALTLEDSDGHSRTAEWFTMPFTMLPSVGDTVRGEIDSSDTRWAAKWVPEGAKKAGGGGFKRSPGETKAIQRQHSQEQALRREANIIAAGGPPYNREQLKMVINFFERDIAERDRGTEWDGLSDDVPADTSGLPWEGPSQEEITNDKS